MLSFRQCLQSNYGKIVSLLPQLSIDEKVKCDPAYLIYIVRLAFITVKFQWKEASAVEIGHLVKQFERLMAAIARQHDHEKFLSTLNMFTTPKHLEGCKSVLMEAAPTINMNSWMHSISEHMISMDESETKPATDKKGISLALTRSLLIYVGLEVELNKATAKFPESKHFLDCCMRMSLFNDGKPESVQYTKCFQLLQKFLETLESDADGWTEAVKQVTELLR